MISEEHSDEIVKTSDVIGKTVVDKSGEKIGKVEEIVLAKRSGEVRYAVLAVGGFLGLGSDFYAIPWKSLHYDKSEEAFRLNIAADRLKDAPGFDKDKWPDFSQSYIKSINEFYI